MRPVHLSRPLRERSRSPCDAGEGGAARITLTVDPLRALTPPLAALVRVAAQARKSGRAAISRAWPGSSAQTRRSRKRRRPDRPSWNRRSICGVSQTAAIRRAMSAWLRGAAPSRRKTRRPDSGSAPVPILVSPSWVCRRALTAHPPGPPWRGRSALRAPRRPRPGTSRERASSRLVLPVPFGPYSTLIRVAGRQVSAA